MPKKAKQPKQLEVGGSVDVPINLSSSVIYVTCALGDTRQMFGRTEWLVSPIEGSGAAWVTESAILSQSGAKVITPSERKAP